LRLKSKRGCRKPGESFPPGDVFRYASPALQDEPMLRECPTGYILREAPWVYPLISLCVAAAENSSHTEISASPRFFQQALQAYRSEAARIDALNRDPGLSGDAAYGAGVLRGR
jgi:hypothetical protein